MLDCLGGRKTTRRVVCSHCNQVFGGTIDNAVADQTKFIRNHLGLQSGSGGLPPALVSADSAGDRIRMRGDGRPELLTKPFDIEVQADGSKRLKIVAQSFEEIVRYIPHMAKALRCTEEHLLEQLKGAYGEVVSRRPGVIHQPISFGGEIAVRSFTKAAMTLWALAIGNDELLAARYDEARVFVVRGGAAFNLERCKASSQPVPNAAIWEGRFDKYFNLIDVSSDATGRVVGSFVLYNAMAWHIVLAESGAPPSRRIALASNPLDPKTWSDGVADEIPFVLDWDALPDYPSTFVHMEQQLGAMMELAQRQRLSQELGHVVERTFDKYGLSELSAATPVETSKAVIGEVSARAAHHFLNLPYREEVTGADLVAEIEALRSQRDDPLK